jgi:hypothetical protein
MSHTVSSLSESLNKRDPEDMQLGTPLYKLKVNFVGGDAKKNTEK